MNGKIAVWSALLASTCLVPLGSSVAGELPAGPSVAHGTVGIAVPKNNVPFRDAVVAALTAIQKAGIHTEMLKKNGLPVENQEAPRLVLAK